MKKIIAIVIALAMLLALTGCIRTQSTLKFNEDGTCDITYLIAGMPELLADPETGEPIELYDEETIEAYKELGFECEEYSEDGYEGYLFSMTADLNAEEDEESGEEAIGAIGMSPVFYVEKDKVIMDYKLLTEQSPEAMAEASAMLEALGGFETITIEFPFVPIESNATSTSEDGKALTWNVLAADHAYAAYALEDFENAGIPTANMSANPFEDIEYGTYYHDAVLWAYENGITTGTSETKFSPAATCTRGQVVTFLWRAMGEPEPETTENPFTDVAETDYFYKAVLWAVENGITTGTSETKFSPATTCSNAHILTFLWRTLGEPDKTGEGEWYTDAANWALAYGFLDGIYEDEFVPTADCPRSDVVTFLYRALSVSAEDIAEGSLEGMFFDSYLGEE